MRMIVNEIPKETERHIKINNVVKETEKAVCVNITVDWNGARQFFRDFWFPKSVARVDKGWLVVKEWFAHKMSRENSFNGYVMTFSVSATNMNL